MTALTLPLGAAEERRHSRALQTPLLSFLALALFGALRWATLFNPSPAGRLIVLALEASAISAAGQLLLPRHRLAALAVLPAGAVLLLVTCGWPWRLLWHLRLGALWSSVHAGAEALPHTLVPYLGSDPATRRVILLGAALLLLAAAGSPLLLPRRLWLAPRLASALPLLALAVLPATLMHPAIPDAQGLLLLGLLTAHLWSGRRSAAAGASLALVLTGAVVAVALAGWLRQPQAWVNPETLGGAAEPGLASFDWTQGYGQLSWSRRGLEVFTVRARRGEYWKTEDLDGFDGGGWIEGESGAGDGLSGVSATARRRWTQTIGVSVDALVSQQVVVAGQASAPHGLPTLQPGAAPGTWTDASGLSSGDSYTASVYDPAPTAAELAASSGARGTPAAVRQLALPIPAAGGGTVSFTFGAFGSGEPAVQAPGLNPQQAEQALAQSPYAGVYGLARRLARGAGRPYAVVAAVLRLLSHGYRYDETPPQSALPLVTFLMQSRAGYCQHFAGAMALLLRMDGIPARVATGFTTGRRDPASGRWRVQDLNAHAWVETWFAHIGWVTFDPTPGADPARASSAPAAMSNLPGEPVLRAAPVTHPPAHRRDVPPASRSSASPRGAGTSGRPPGSAGAAWPLVAVVLLALAGAAALMSVRLHPPGVEAQLSELERALRRMGRPLDPSLSLRSLARRLRDDPAAEEYLLALERRRYGDGGAPPSLRGRRALRAQLRAGVGPGATLRSLWALPPRWVLLH